jgi:hypothetical protein
VRRRDGDQLVLEYLEDLSGRLLDAYRPVVKQMIGGRPGVYALYRRGRLYYVGLAKNLMSRLRQHLRDKHRRAWDRFNVYLTVRIEHTKELESLLLRIVDPSGNRQGGRFVRAKDGQRRLNRLLAEADADKRAVLMGGRAAKRRIRAKTRRTKGSRVLAGLVDRGVKLRRRYGGRDYRAVLRRDGTIRFGGRLYDSPSAAALAAAGKRKSGWSFWRYRDRKGNWVRLRQLKR